MTIVLSGGLRLEAVETMLTETAWELNLSLGPLFRLGSSFVRLFTVTVGGPAFMEHCSITALKYQSCATPTFA